MSQRTHESDKAIRDAWIHERELVKLGMGTRDWSPEHQREILDKGKAYDSDGRAFQGHHMQSVFNYPEYQGCMDNIQFLSRKEHLEAHGGSTHNPTNGYYNPITGETIDYGNEPPRAREVFMLTSPIIVSPTIDDLDFSIEKEIYDSISVDVSLEPDTITSTQVLEMVFASKLVKRPSKKEKAIAWFNDAVNKLVNDPAFRMTTNHIVDELAPVGAELLMHRIESENMIHHPFERAVIDEIANENVELIEHENLRKSPREHEVSPHKQRYYTKDGVVWREKGPYKRGYNDDE